MKGVEFAEVRDTITRVFSPQEFDEFLHDRLDFDREVEIQSGSLREIVSNVLKRFEREGMDARLIAEVAAVRPLRPDVQEIYEKFAFALIVETRRNDIAAGVVQAYEQFGLAPRVALQSCGKAQLASALSAADSGFEVAVREHLPPFDVAIWRERLFKNESRVCRIELNDHEGRMGTGFLVGPDAVLTNYHVMQSIIDPPADATKVKCRFDFKELATGIRSEGVLVGLHEKWSIDFSPYSDAEARKMPDAVAPTADELDYALIRLERAIGAEPIQPTGTDIPIRGWIHLPTARPAITRDMPVLILQHPDRGPLKLAFDTDAQVSVIHDGRRIRYRTNTEGGSSGSPCFNLNWQLLALHHYGDPKAAIGSADYNQGVPVDVIRARISAQGRANFLGGKVA